MCSNAGDSNSSDKFEERFLRLEDDGDDAINCDCEFIVGPQNIVVKGHKLLFSAASKVFKAMFYGNIKEDKVVIVNDLDPDSFQGMKRFIYSGEVNFTSAMHALKIYTAARKYLIPALSKKCISYITDEERIQPSEVLEFYDYCKIYNISEFEELCGKIIQGKTDEVVRSEYFVSAKIESVELILKSPTLKLGSEIEVFDYFEKWALAEALRKKIRVEDLGSSFNNLKKHIRFLTVSSKGFVSRVDESLLLTQEEKYAIAINLMGFKSKPMSANLSSEQKNRNFTSSKKEKNNIHKFIVPIKGPFCSFSGKTTILEIETISVNITYTKIAENICFQIKTLKKRNPIVMKYLMTVKAKLKVLPVAEEEYDDSLLFENEFYIALDWNTKEEHEVILAKIPISKLRKQEFLRETDNTVIIEGLFVILFEEVS